MKKIKIMLGFIAISLISGCSNAQNLTPKKYKYYDTVSSDVYQKHIMILKDSIRNLINTKQEPYYQKENDSATEIFIDTILYSPQKDKIAAFVITQNTNDKLIDKGNAGEFHYAAHCFIGRLNNNYYVRDITWVRGYNLSNYKSFKDASKRIREIYFKELTERTNAKGESTYKYNLDDVRFWDGPLWKKYYDE